MSNTPIDLAYLDENFVNESADERQDFDPIPDGKYQVSVEKVELTEAQSTGNPMIKWTLRIIAPRFVNRLMWRNSVITKKTLRFLKTDLHLCGLDLEKLSDLPKRLEELLDIRLDVVKKTKGDNENIFFNRRITASTEAAPVKGLTDDGLVPF